MNLLETTHEALAHSTEGGIVEPGVVGDDAHNALVDPVNLHLREPNEFDVVILKPFGILLTERLSVDEFVGFD